jgi:carboxylesterase type B
LPGNASDPNTTYDNLLPVIYWIHGGAFSIGSVLTYSAEKFMDKDVVLVEVQYRLGPLGWLSLNTDEIPGNAGIFDQIEGLKWTRKFAKYFGGDPNCVTIAGESAGGASVSMLMLAPQARGTFLP